MSKKTVPFSIASYSLGATESSRLGIAERQPGGGVEDWVNQQSHPTPQMEIATVRFRSPADFVRPGVTIMLADDANWIELVNFTLVVPYLSACHWMFRTWQKWLDNVTWSMGDGRR